MSSIVRFTRNYIDNAEHTTDATNEQPDYIGTPTCGLVNFIHYKKKINVIAQVTFLTSMCFDFFTDHV